jgi:hypothetical protein
VRRLLLSLRCEVVIVSLTMHTVMSVCSARRVMASESVTVDLSGQAVFEAGVLLWGMAFRRHPIDDSYPLILDVPARSRGSVDPCTLSVDERAAASAAGYPVDEFATLVRGMVAMDPATRPSLTEARRRLEATMNSICVSEDLANVC